MATLGSLQEKIRKLEQQAQALVSKQASGVIEKIRDLMEKHGLTTADIDAPTRGKQRATKTPKKVTAKPASSVARYRDPKTGATWSGHGRAPAWIATAKNRDRFLIDASATTSNPAPAGKAKVAGAYVRGPQPAMYRDPRSGATWSGRGRAPAWLANVKDRSRFLIDGPAIAPGAVRKTTEPQVKAGKDVAGKAVVRKAATKKASATRAATTKTTVKEAVAPVAPANAKTVATRKPAKKSPDASSKVTAKKTSPVPAKKAAAKQGAEVAVRRPPVRKIVTAKSAPIDTVATSPDVVPTADSPVETSVSITG
ncbi:H-NS family nucleoid-associated regulatory protein [Paraburkholderia aromaticivorans]|uniref:H-NS family nucleoid-associated regulatory protein n=1 Tax=Paraburkholderia aromaticivorans TaxID=2026199 RepID=UPI00145621B1|nr:H-NS family nucleoid-associated regulatory protein [Paraburkholderia aromaticivorans]